MRQTAETLSVRELQTLEYEKESWEKQAAQQLALKRLEIEVMQKEASWSALLRLPLALLMLPVRFVMAFAVLVAAITKFELPQEYWDFIKLNK